MSNTIKVLINSDGITGRAYNPYEFDRANNFFKYDTFEANVKSYTVIGSGLKAGDVVECEPVWQWHQKLFSKWETLKSDAAEAFMKQFPHQEYRQAYLIVESKESKPNEIADKIKEILKGIDKDEWEDNDGWWETSTGAEFGAKKLNEVIDFVLSLNINIT